MKVYMLVGTMGDVEIEMSVHKSWDEAAVQAGGATEEFALEADVGDDEATEWASSITEALERDPKSRKYLNHEDKNTDIEWRIKECNL